MKKQTNLPLSIELNRIQPQATALEEAVLGALLVESKAYTQVEDILMPEDFYSSANETIYRAILNLESSRKPIDMLTVVEELKRIGELDNIGGPLYIVQLADKVASSAHIVYHAQIIKQKSQARQLINLTSSIQQKAYDETADISETIEELDKSLTEIVNRSVGCQSISMQEAVTLALDEASTTQENAEKGIISTITTGLRSLDEEIDGGWHAPELIIIGARPSMGKTQLALSFAKAAGLSGNDVLFISIEMTVVQLINRYLLEDSIINKHNLRTGQMSAYEWEAVDQKAKQLWGVKMNIADKPEIRFLNNLKAEARRMTRKQSVKIMIIDYLQLIKTNMKFERRQLEVAYITGELKNLAKELNIPIIALSQINRPPKGLTKKALAMNEPKLDDLREAGDIEQDADKVIFIHKPDYYDADALDSNGSSWKNKGKLIIAKDREGMRNQTIVFYHDERYKKIWDKYININEVNSKTLVANTPPQDLAYLEEENEVPF